jgi:hypothetical protein
MIVASATIDVSSVANATESSGGCLIPDLKGWAEFMPSLRDEEL